MNFKYKKYAEALYDALREDAFYYTMERSVGNGSSKEAMLRYMDFSMMEGEKYGELYMPETHDAGASIWLRPLDEEREKEMHKQKKAFLKDRMGTESLHTYTSIVNFMSKKSFSLLSDIQHPAFLDSAKASLRARISSRYRARFVRNDGFLWVIRQPVQPCFLPSDRGPLNRPLRSRQNAGVQTCPFSHRTIFHSLIE